MPWGASKTSFYMVFNVNIATLDIICMPINVNYAT